MSIENSIVNELEIVLEFLKRLDGDEIANFEILKRDTTDKSDYIYCMIKYIVEDEERTEYYVLNYHFSMSWNLTDYFSVFLKRHIMFYKSSKFW